MEKILILMSTFNGQKYLEKQIDSILKQKTKLQVNLLIRDDGSTDNTVNLLKKIQLEYKDLITLILGENIGVNFSFFDLIERAGQYNYYAFSDQDDIWLENKIENAVNKMKELETEKSEPILYGSSSFVVDNEMKVKGKTTKQRREISLENTIIQNFMPGHSQVFNSELLNILRQVNCVDKIYVYDAWVTNVAMLFGKIIFDNESQTLYRQHDDNVLGFADNSGPFSWFKERMKRVRNSESKKQSVQILYFYNSYKEKIPVKSNVEILKFINSQNNVFKRITFSLTTRLYRQSKLQTILFKALYVAGGYTIRK